MADSKENRNSPDSRRIDLSEDYEVRYWSNKFGVSADELKQAVGKAGTSAHKVEEYLRGNTHRRG